MPELFTITEEWNEQYWMNTGGTRAKKYLQSPEGKFYYFKRSQLKPGKDYRYEFWSEIIASELGSFLGFNMLRYDAATYGNLMGCISESMINSDQEELIEGVKYLQAFAPTYDPSLKAHQNRYTFDLIKNSLERAGIKKYLSNVVEIIVLDALIGNGDRHQENWAIINKLLPMHEAIEHLEKEGIVQKENRFVRWFLRWAKKISERTHKENSDQGKKTPKPLYVPKTIFAPVYDSGSSLGRELSEERVAFLLQSGEDLNRYIDKGQSEIHWDNKKLTHFQLIEQLLLTEYNETVKCIIYRILEKWDEIKIEQIIRGVDSKVPETHALYRIPDNRKALIFKIVTLRRNRLKDLINEGV